MSEFNLNEYKDWRKFNPDVNNAKLESIVNVDESPLLKDTIDCYKKLTRDEHDLRKINRNYKNISEAIKKAEKVFNEHKTQSSKLKEKISKLEKESAAKINLQNHLRSIVDNIGFHLIINNENELILKFNRLDKKNFNNEYTVHINMKDDLINITKIDPYLENFNAKNIENTVNELKKSKITKFRTLLILLRNEFLKFI